MTTEQQLLAYYKADKQISLDDMSLIVEHLQYIHDNEPDLLSRLRTIMRELKLKLIEAEFDNRQININFD